MIESQQLRTPYAGLAPYTEEDWPFFFGRKLEQKIIATNMRGARLTLLYGPSGVGKSSVLRAGVMHDLAQLALQNPRKQKPFVIVFDSWRDDPKAGLLDEIRNSLVKTSDGNWTAPEQPSDGLGDTLHAWTERLDARLLIILDQFEDYFFYHGKEEGERSFAKEFCRAVNRSDLRISFLISIREDAFAKLDRFKHEIPNLFGNCLRIEYLDDDGGREAIEQPIAEYNRRHPATGQQVSIEPALVDAVLEQVKINKVVVGAKGLGAVKKDEKHETEGVETPYLQLVMTRIWDEESKGHTRALRVATLTRLGGAESIVQEHLYRTMKRLSLRERIIAARAFRYLVTPSGYRIAQTASDLAELAKVDEVELVPLLEKLLHRGNRILHTVAGKDKVLYEISHDVLARAVADWSKRYEKIDNFFKGLRKWAVVVVLFILVSVLFSRNFINERTKRRQAVAAGNVTSDVLAKLYQKVVLPKDNPIEAQAKLGDTLQMLSNALETYHKDGNSVGEGITLRNIAGLYRVIGESNIYFGAQDRAHHYLQQAQEQYQQALILLRDSLGKDHVEVAHGLNDLAYISVLEGRYAEAEPLFEQAQIILEQALSPDDRYLADGLRNLAECYREEGKYDEAARLYGRVLEIRKIRLSEDDPELVQSYYDSAFLYYDRGKHAQAEPLFNRALEIQKATRDSTDSAQRLNDLAWVFYEQGNYARAEQRFLEALAIWKLIPDSRTLGEAISLNGLAVVSGKQGKVIEAEQYLKQAATPDPTSINSYSEAYDLFQLALYYDVLGKAEAESSYHKVISIWQNSLGREHPHTALGLRNLASFYYRHGRSDDAESLFNEARSIQEALPYSPYLAQTLYGLAQMYTARGKYAEAEPLFAQALGIQERAIPEHSDFANTLDAYAELLTKTDRKGAADDMRKRAEQIRQIHSKEDPDN